MLGLKQVRRVALRYGSVCMCVHRIVLACKGTGMLAEASEQDRELKSSQVGTYIREGDGSSRMGTRMCVSVSIGGNRLHRATSTVVKRKQHCVCVSMCGFWVGGWVGVCVCARARR